MKHKDKSTYAEVKCSPGCIWSNIVRDESSFHILYKHAFSFGHEGLAG